MATKKKQRKDVKPETLFATRNFPDHDHVECARCGELVGGPHQSAEALALGGKHWARQCSKCYTITAYSTLADLGFEEPTEDQKAQNRLTNWP